ncbi:uncharacterized protein BKA78DRAFT_188088 [Phyllosticta capitalensis]|uniref:uncharacterized protein n=1 Tax=Phyllosticta capitalensis TaxID=121624 RepID=UPI00313013D4
MDRDLPLYDVQLARLRDLKRQQRLRRLIYFRLESDSMPNRASPTDLWIPKLRKYESTPEGTVQHLDEISMWRNLSPAQAKEILFWEKMLAAVLEYIVSNHLIDMIDELGLENHFAEPDTISRIICAFVNSVGCRTFAVDIQEVITSMIELFGIHGSQHHWLASCGDFRNGLCEFLRTRDCFLDTPVSPTVKVSFSASMNHRGEPTVCGQMKRYGPHVSFSRLDSQVFLDRSCHVHPVFVDPILNIGYNARVGYPEYDLKSDCVEFGWSPLHDGFVGFLRNGHIKHSTQPTPKVFDLTATGTRLFPEGVKFERTIRLKINVTEARLRVSSEYRFSLPGGNQGWCLGSERSISHDEFFIDVPSLRDAVRTTLSWGHWQRRRKLPSRLLGPGAGARIDMAAAAFPMAETLGEEASSSKIEFRKPDQNSPDQII